MRRELALILPLFAACGGPHGDAGWYGYALADATDVDSARKACNRVHRVVAREDCLEAVFERFDQISVETCAEIKGQIWHDGCLFQLAQKTGATGAVADGVHICKELRGARWCVYRLMTATVERARDLSPTDAEPLIDSFAGVPAMNDAPKQFWLMRFKDQEQRGVALDVTDCVSLDDPPPCQEAMDKTVRAWLDTAARKDLPKTCVIARLDGDWPARWVRNPRVEGSLLSWAEDRCRGWGQ